MSTYDLDVLELAFTRHVLAEIAHADDELVTAEEALMERLCPSERLVQAGLLDENGQPTHLWQTARAQALERLPLERSLDDRLALVTRFLEMAVVDGHLHRDEGSLLFRAAQLLAITPHQFDVHLDSLTEHVGAVDLDAEE
jgi:uncharacterized tellurite resistance protein B-like protein